MANILIVEDDPHIRRFVLVNLKIRGHTVMEAGSGEDGLKLLSLALFQLIILDIRLPGISGWDFLDRIGQDARFNTLPVIVATASLADMPERRYRFPQIADVIFKPMSIGQLMTSVDRALVALHP